MKIIGSVKNKIRHSLKKETTKDDALNSVHATYTVLVVFLVIESTFYLLGVIFSTNPPGFWIDVLDCVSGVVFAALSIFFHKRRNNVIRILITK